jgi:hypothetical protein
MQQVNLNYTSSAANLTGFASNVTGAAFALTTLVTGDDLGHKVTIRNDTANDHAAKTAVITGSMNGMTVTETVNLPGPSATVTSTNYYDTLVSVVHSATIGVDTMDIGWAAASISKWVWFKTQSGDTGFNFGFGCTITGTPGYSVQFTFDGVTAFNHADVVTETTSQAGVISSPVGAIRLIFTANGGVNLMGIQR